MTLKLYSVQIKSYSEELEDDGVAIMEGSNSYVSFANSEEEARMYAVAEHGNPADITSITIDTYDVVAGLIDL